MVCRESRLSSAMITVARDMNGLEDNQCLGLNHALMQEGASTERPTPQQWNEFIDSTVQDYSSGRLWVGGGSRDPRRRLEAARNEAPDGPRFYAAQRIVTRARDARNAHVEYLNNYARAAGTPGTHAATAFWTSFADATDNASLQPTPAFVTAFVNNPDNTHLPTDRRSMYAYEQMENARVAGLAQQQTRPSVTRQPPRNPSNAIQEMGYDPINGRAEVVMHSNPDRVYAYRMTQQEWDEFAAAPSAGRYFAQNIRGNPNFQYESQEASDSEAVHRRCATCGQWNGPVHFCPITGSEEDLNRDVRLAVEAARARNPEQPVPAHAPIPTADVTRMPDGRTRNHPHEHGNLRCAYPNRIRQEARRNDQIKVPVRYGSADGETVEGLALVGYAGRGAGYTTTAVTEPGDSGVDNLRCTCAEYRRTYRCEHLTAALGHMDALVNERDVPSVDTVRAAAAEATANLTSEHDASTAATAAAAENWQPLGENFTDNPEKFQTLYEEYRAKRQAYKEAIENGQEAEYPIPYIETEAFGGIANPDSGRRFGVEIEYEFDENMSYDERRNARLRIGRELRSARLTADSRQREYGASHGWYREHHEEGWSYEEDPSTDGGGEIISPAMADEPDTWTNIKTVCDILARNGAQPKTHSGMHINVSTGDYDHTVANHNRLLTAYQENEDLLFRLASNPDRGRHRGGGYCRPNRGASGPYATVQRANHANTGKHLALNLASNNGSERGRVEFRVFDSTLNPATMQAHIGTALYMTEAGGRDGAIPDTPRTTSYLGQRYEANPNRRALTGDDWNESTKGVRSFLDTYVPGTPDGNADTRVRQIVALFAMTKWQRDRRGY